MHFLNLREIWQKYLYIKRYIIIYAGPKLSWACQPAKELWKHTCTSKTPQHNQIKYIVPNFCPRTYLVFENMIKNLTINKQYLINLILIERFLEI